MKVPGSMVKPVAMVFIFMQAVHGMKDLGWQIGSTVMVLKNGLMELNTKDSI